MRLHSLKTRGVGMPFRAREVSIDFDALPQGLIALVGDNGAGKTTLLECSGPATLYRVFPSYDNESVTDHVAPGVRDAFSEVVFSIGADRFRAMVQADPSFGGGRGKNEAYLFRASGHDWNPVAGPLVKEYDAAIERILPSKELFLASVFACQGGDGSFFGLAKASRKDLFGSLLGLAHLQEKSEASRARAQGVVQRLERAREEIAAADARQTRVAALEQAIAAKRDVLADLDARASAARSDQEKAQAELAAAKETLTRAEADAAAATRERARLEAGREEAQQKVGALLVRLDGITATLANADEVRGAAARLDALDAEIRAAQEAERAATEKLRPLDAEIATLDAQRATLLTDHRRLSTEIERARAAADRVEQGATLEREVAGQREQLAKATAELEECAREFPGLEAAAEAEIQRVERRRILVARRDDLSPQTATLGQIPGVPACEGCVVISAARDARDKLVTVERELAEIPAGDEMVARSALQALRERQERFQGQRAIAQRWLAENAPKLERLAVDREQAAKAVAAEQDLARVTNDGNAVRARLEEAKEARESHEAERAGADEKTRALTAERKALAESAAKLEHVAAAEAQRAEVEEALTAAKIAAKAAAETLADMPAVDVDTPRGAVATAESEVLHATERAEMAASRANTERGELAKLTGEREALGDPAGDLAPLRDRESLLARDAGDWTLLEKALGRDGVQALAIDAAGPTVSALANDLLAACYGPRFSLALETTAQTKDGKKQREVFDVRILDAEAGREAKQGSGGEMVLLDEALRLALAIFNTQRSGVPLRTLWRDETTGALSPENADRYVAMLRRAMELGGFERCLFIAHAEAVWQQADARIFIANGAVSFDEQRGPA